jgi:hypothetical protein
MKLRVIAFYFLTWTLISCHEKKEFKKTNLRFALKNATNYDMLNITVGPGDTNLFFVYLPANHQTNWTYVKSAYNYGLIKFYAKNKFYKVRPVDYEGESVIESGDLIYIIKSIDTLSHHFEFDFTLTEIK